MLQRAYATGCTAAFDHFQIKDAGLRQSLMPLLLAGGIGGGGTAAAAGIHHLTHHPVAPMAAPMAAPTVAPAAPALPTFGGALQQETGRLDSILNAR